MPSVEFWCLLSLCFKAFHQKQFPFTDFKIKKQKQPAEDLTRLY